MIFDFHTQMLMSEGVSDKKNIGEIILSAFPTAIKVEKANKSDDKHGTDYWVTTQAGHTHSLDVKVRSRDYSKNRPDRDDLALEIWSVVEKKVIGWTRDVNKRTDYIMWIWKDTGRWSLVPFPMLCGIFVKNWEEWRKKYQTAIQHTDLNGFQYKSECVYVPRKVVWGAIYITFGGKIA
jgi:hypothetical protein